MPTPPGRIVVLNGPPRAGKSSTVAAIQDLDGVWMNVGVDHAQAMTPQRFQPGIGMRPGGERPDLEPLVATLWVALYEAIAAHSRAGVDVVVDAVHHDSYSRPLRIRERCAEVLEGLPVLFVGVRCPVDVIRERRRVTWGGLGHAPAGPAGDPVILWDEAVHAPGIYDMEVDTSRLTPDECAARIADRLAEDAHGTAFFRRG